VLGGSSYALRGFDREENKLSSIERYSVASDWWSELIEGKLGTVRGTFGAHVLRLAMDLFDSLTPHATSQVLVCTIMIIVNCQ
jgi:hypothetical protein